MGHHEFSRKSPQASTFNLPRHNYRYSQQVVFTERQTMSIRQECYMEASIALELDSKFNNLKKKISESMSVPVCHKPHKPGLTRPFKRRGNRFYVPNGEKFRISEVRGVSAKEVQAWGDRGWGGGGGRQEGKRVQCSRTSNHGLKRKLGFVFIEVRSFPEHYQACSC